MSVRHEDLTEAEVAHQEALDRSWSAANEALTDPEFRARLHESLVKVNESRSSATKSKAEFLSATEPSVG